MVRRACRAILFPPNENLQRGPPGSCLATIPPGGPRCGREHPDEPTQCLRGLHLGARRGGTSSSSAGPSTSGAAARSTASAPSPRPPTSTAPTPPAPPAARPRPSGTGGPPEGFSAGVAAPAGPGSPRSSARCWRGPSPTWRPGAASSASCGSTCPSTPWPRRWA